MTETASNGTVTLTIDNRLAHVQLGRPDKLNSLTREVFQDLVEIGQRLRGRTEIACVVLTGEGRAFCAGLDLGEFGKMKTGEKNPAVSLTERIGAARALGQQAVHIWSMLEVPVIAGVHGVAFGGGLQVAMGADVRIVAPDTKMSMMEVNWGLVPDMTGTQVLPRLVGPSQAKLLTFTGEVFSGARAGEIGLADEVTDTAVERALEIGREIADKSRSALVWAKKLIDMAGTVDLAEGLDAEQDALAELMGGPEQVAAVDKRMAQLAARKKESVS
jgi:enoyl-CoA hydratase/carnithine racemase